MLPEALEFLQRKMDNTYMRVPVYSGPCHDWAPDHNWGGSGNPTPGYVDAKQPWNKVFSNAKVSFLILADLLICSSGRRSPSTERFKAAWELVIHAYGVKGYDVRQLRLQRYVENFQRQQFDEK